MNKQRALVLAQKIWGAKAAVKTVAGLKYVSSDPTPVSGRQPAGYFRFDGMGTTWPQAFESAAIRLSDQD